MIKLYDNTDDFLIDPLVSSMQYKWQYKIIRNNTNSGSHGGNQISISR